MEFKKGTIVSIKANCERYSGKLNGRRGVVAVPYNTRFRNVAVLIDGCKNINSDYGYYYFTPNDLYKFHGENRSEKPVTSISPFAIKKVYFNDPVTVVIWEDGTKTIVRCSKNEMYDPEKGLAMAISKKALGNDDNYYKYLKKWLPIEKSPCESCWNRNKLYTEQLCLLCLLLGGYSHYDPISTKK